MVAEAVWLWEVVLRWQGHLLAANYNHLVSTGPARRDAARYDPLRRRANLQVESIFDELLTALAEVQPDRLVIVARCSVRIA
jgi:hypothetical protein